MKFIIGMIGSLFLTGIMWRQEGHYIYHRPASSFAAWASEVAA